MYECNFAIKCKYSDGSEPTEMIEFRATDDDAAIIFEALAFKNLNANETLELVKVDPHHSEWNLSIKLGNDAMQDNLDVANALMQAAHKVQDHGELREHPTPILDLNGNIVGKFGLTPQSE